MTASLVGGAFLSSFIGILFNRLSDPAIIKMMRGKKVDQKLLQKLENILNVVETVLNDAEKKQITDPAVKRWLENLQDAVYDADDLLDEVATKASIQKDPPGNFLFRFLNLQDREMVTRIEDIIARLEDIAKHKDILGLENIAAKNMAGKLPSTSLVKKSDIFVGRDKERDTILKLLLDDGNDGELSVIPIVGMGGIGKTTLAKVVYNDDKVHQKFRVFKAWVCVGEEEFDVLKVTKAVIEKICSPCNSNDLDTVQNHLKNALAGANFLVVLDDLWSSNREDWECFLTPFECGSEGGKILVTTRLDTVASMVKTKHNESHNLSLLDEEQCWSVFANRAWDPAESRDHSALEEIGRKIVEKCKGLPLAAQTVGGLLRGKDNEKEWNDVLNSEFWELSEEDSGILPALRISYYHLPSYLKRCFVYCSLYPKDFEFDRVELTLLWMAEGLLLQPKSGNTLEETGYEYFDDLISRSFFQHSNSAKNSFVMHDLMHDLATFYGGKFFSRIFELKNTVKHDTKTRHLSCAPTNDEDLLMKITEACDRLKHARTLLQIFDKYGLFSVGDRVAVSCDLLEQLKCLRVLSFNFCSDDENLMRGSIGKLIHLRYLDLSCTSIVTLPDSLSCLYNLQTLKLRYCEKLKKLPSNMQHLVNLRYLDIDGTGLEEMPKKMSKLKDLQFLSHYIAGKHEENGIGELGELAHLHWYLNIGKLENVKNSGEASNARMDEKIHLNALYLKWSWSSFEESEDCDSQTEKDVLDKLRPHKDLKKLFIRCYRGTMFPDWIGQSSYHVTELVLGGCRNCWVLPSLGQLPALTRLEISGFDMVKKIGCEFYKSDATHRHQEKPFRSLKYVSFRDMGCWEEWESFACDDDDAPFPQLEKLVIKHCPKLRGDLPTFLPSLKSLVIEKCEELACDLPRAPIISQLEIYGKQEARMRDLPLSVQHLSISGKQLVEYVFEAMTHTQPTSLSYLFISKCSSAISFPGDSLPPSLRNLSIIHCKNVEFPMQQQQQHHSLQTLFIDNSCGSLTSFALPAFPKLKHLTIARREDLTSLGNITLPASLHSLQIFECPLLGEGIERKDPHIWPSISHIPYISVDRTLIHNDSTS
ncbi:putative disease resistance RPP13-like protein 1 [Arachis hypogaea]|uniref:putative disease resistance RPP13-like protein 1 n=1 Tax=Arachis hypogaea TaxID=3818 RepID=UPI000DED3478|nr:putative disease resistance RPP13-like protein 1 [Arachis hypogaea]XP_025660076.1 putative disease resistance RPP13-like protein 1 [Arachis hypogaea]XP_025660083.1 putative disease resistance RPP13-like protein 1 [Arachis hypogaea]QHO26160.1 Putative disease resistance RPP13-like protein [Arachis hypogaea]